MIFDNLHTVDYVVLGSLAAFFLAQVYFYARYMAAPLRKMRRSRKAKSASPTAEEMPGVSVILCAHNEAQNLSQYLQALLTQDYPTYEVIVVDDGSQDETRNVIESYLCLDKRLHSTFVPYGARVRSTKKLALTLAAKAAQYEYLLLTDADCVPESKDWIREMMKGFEMAQGDKGQKTKDIVLGFGAYFEEKGFVNRLVRFDTLFNGLHYMGAALCRHPYMGVGRNLAYRKSLFFESGGFTHLMGTQAGDDDLFVNHVATRKNTTAVVSRESITWSLAKTSLREWWQQKRRHVSVSPKYRLGTKIRLTLEPVTRGLFYAMVIAVAAYYKVSVFGLAAVGLFLIRWIMQTAILNTSARKIGLKGFSMLSVLWFDITLPLVNLWMLTVPKKQSKW